METKRNEDYIQTNHSRARRNYYAAKAAIGGVVYRAWHEGADPLTVISGDGEYLTVETQGVRDVIAWSHAVAVADRRRAMGIAPGVANRMHWVA